MKNKVFVSGASGFIGKKLVLALEKDNCHIRVLSRKFEMKHETIICDLENASLSKGALNGIRTVFHLAAFAHDLRSESKVHSKYQKINVDATIDLAKNAIKSGVKHFIYVSSVKAGGSSPKGQCLKESDQFSPEGIYGKTKREAELKLLELCKTSDMHITIIRPALVYGPNVKGNLKLMMIGIEKGWFPPLPIVSNRRSMIHVDDLVRSLLFISKKDAETNGQIYIVTDNYAYSSSEIYDSLCLALGKNTPSWRAPKVLFKIVSYVSPRIHYKVNKLLGNEFYSSNKIQSIGFKPELSIREINETSI
jgi:UDP-glucose 4-epimerase